MSRFIPVTESNEALAFPVSTATEEKRMRTLDLFKAAAAVGLCVLMAGCAAPVTRGVAVDSTARAQEERVQMTMAIKAEAELTKRLFSVGYGVLKGAADQCKDVVRQSAGMRVLSLDRFPEGRRALAASALGVDSFPRVFVVYKGGAAELAGIKVGDVLDPQSTAITPRADESREAALRRLPKGVAVPVRVNRGGQELTVQLTPDSICDYPLRLANESVVNAYADGKSIMVTRGMMRFATDDRELALVIGHELAHNTMGHIDKKTANAVVGMVFDILAASKGVNTNSAFGKAGAQAYSQAFESEADYVGMYYLARAGYDSTGAADFWRRMAAEHPGNIKGNYSASHPSTTERFLSLEKVSDEVKLKQTSGGALSPNMK